MPDIIQPIVKVLPIAHLSSALRETMNLGTPFLELGTETLILGAWLVGGFGWPVMCLSGSDGSFSLKYLRLPYAHSGKKVLDKELLKRLNEKWRPLMLIRRSPFGFP